MFLIPELKKLLKTKSIILYLPPNGTPGFGRFRVNGLRRSPFPPAPPPGALRRHVEQTTREKENAIDMHRIFQRDLCKVRLSTARAYVKLIGSGAAQGPRYFRASGCLRSESRSGGGVERVSRLPRNLEP